MGTTCFICRTVITCLGRKAQRGCSLVHLLVAWGSTDAWVLAVEAKPCKWWRRPNHSFCPGAQNGTNREKKTKCDLCCFLFLHSTSSVTFYSSELGFDWEMGWLLWCLQTGFGLMVSVLQHGNTVEEIKWDTTAKGVGIYSGTNQSEMEYS